MPRHTEKMKHDAVIGPSPRGPPGILLPAINTSAAKGPIAPFALCVFRPARRPVLKVQS